MLKQLILSTDEEIGERIWWITQVFILRMKNFKGWTEDQINNNSTDISYLRQRRFRWPEHAVELYRTIRIDYWVS